MNRKLTTIALILISMQSYSQVGVGTLIPNQSSEIDIVSNDKGILIPRVSLGSITDTTTITAGNVNSLLVFNTNETDTLKKGYYYWYTDQWIKVINQDDLVYNESLTVVGSDLVLRDTEGNIVTIPVEDINLPDVVTNMSYDDATGILTYVNEEGNSSDVNLSEVVKNFETLTSLQVNTTDGVLEYTDENNVLNVVDLKQLVRNNQKTYSIVNGEHTTTATAITGNNTEFKVNVNTSTLTPALGNTLSAEDSSIVVSNGTGATLVNASIKVKDGGISTEKLAADSVTNEKLADNAVSTENIVNGTILTEDFANNAITSSKIVNRTIVEEDLANGAVTSQKIENETIIKQDLANGAVTTAKILDGTIITADFADSAVNSSKIEDLSILNEDFANNAITTEKILDGTIENRDIKDKTISSVKLDGTGWAPGTVLTVQNDGTVIYEELSVNASNVSNAKNLKATAGDNSLTVVNGTATLLKEASVHVTDKGITTAKLADNAVTTAKLADNAVTSAKISNGTIIVEDLANNSISTGKIINGSVVLNKLADNSVNSDKIVNESIINQDIANRTIQASKLDGTGYPQGYVLTVLDTSGTVVYKTFEVDANSVQNSRDLTAGDTSIVVNNGTGTTILNTSVIVAPSGITTSKLADLAVTTAKIQDNSVNSNKILDNSIVNADIANQNISASKLNGGNNNNGKVATVVDNNGKVEFQPAQINANQITNAGNLTTTLPLKVNGTTSLPQATLINTNLTVNTAGVGLGVVKQSNNATTRTIGINQEGIVSVNATPLAGNGLVANENKLEVNALNGLQVTNNQLVLGGNLVSPTSIATTSTNTLALTGLTNVSNDDHTYLTVNNTTGVLKTTDTAKPEYFYAPSIALPVVPDGLTATGDISYSGGSFKINLYDIYRKQYGMEGNVTGANRTAIKNPSAGTLDIHSSTDLEYYVTYFDNKVFNPTSITISAAGVLTYTVLTNSEVTENTYMNVVFKVK